MFTGIIEQTGEILAVNAAATAKKFKIKYPSSGSLEVGESINLNGACQTVIQISDSSFWVEAMQETLKRSNLNQLQVGDEVNLERSLKVSDRISGHLVTGHVDTTGLIAGIETFPDSRVLRISFPSEFKKFVAPKGSIAINGISLTIIESEQNYFTVGLIPYTWQKTNLNKLKIGAQVNLEFDLIAKYLESLLNKQEKEGKITGKFLQDAGW